MQIQNRLRTESAIIDDSNETNRQKPTAAARITGDDAEERLVDGAEGAFIDDTNKL